MSIRPSKKTGQIGGITVSFGDGNNPIVVGDEYAIEQVPWDFTFTGWTISTLNGSHSAAVDIYKTTYTNYPSGFATIDTAHRASLSSANKNTSTNFTGSLSKGDFILISVSSVDLTVTNLQVKFVGVKKS